MPVAPDTLENIHPQLRGLAVAIELLHEDPDNANEHGEFSRDTLVQSFTEFGQRKNIVVRREGMIVEAGNGTLAALRGAGWSHIACVICDDDETKAKAFALVDNQAARLSKWNFEQLRVNAEALLAVSYDVTSLGFTPDTLADILAGKAGELAEQFNGDNSSDPDPAQPPPPEQPSEPEPEPPIPEPPAEPITQFGDVIELGPHTLHCADCMDVLAGMADNSIDSIVCDPSYGLSSDGKARTWDDIAALLAAGKHAPKAGLLGREWDAGVPGITWARECLRVLKPGGHIIAFSATRTIHRLTCAIEDAGFEIRDQIGWLYWQGMPHSMDVSKAIDKMKFDREQVLTVTKWIAEARDAAGIRNKDIDNAFGFAGMSGHWTSQKSQPAVPTLEQIPTLLAVLKVEDPPEAIRRLLLDLNAAKGEPGTNWWKREVVGTGYRIRKTSTTNIAGASDGEFAITKAASEDAARWAGWSTNLKPAIEPAVLARKPLSESTVALNVLKWGTGALNTSACMHAANDPAWPGPWASSDPKWPANIYHAPKPSSAERTAGLDDVDARHETVKPRKLFAQLITLVTPPGGTIYEPFGGSGTTPVAAPKGMRVIISELSPKYADIICARVRWSLAQP